MPLPHAHGSAACLYRGHAAYGSATRLCHAALPPHRSAAWLCRKLTPARAHTYTHTAHARSAAGLKGPEPHAVACLLHNRATLLSLLVKHIEHAYTCLPWETTGVAPIIHTCAHVCGKHRKGLRLNIRASCLAASKVAVQHWLSWLPARMTVQDRLFWLPARMAVLDWLSWLPARIAFLDRLFWLQID